MKSSHVFSFFFFFFFSCLQLNLYQMKNSPQIGLDINKYNYNLILVCVTNITQ